MKTNKRLATLTFCKNIIKQFMTVTLLLYNYVKLKEIKVSISKIFTTFKVLN